ncbi:MAG: DUF2177 family protein [Hyphomicrobiaceae bacterium]|nr:DUF2177 family protein [Hyphomicrobiaceae bacterium]
MRYVTAYLAAGVTLLVLDVIWLTAMGSTYRRLLDGMLTEGFRLAPAAIFYFIYVAGIVTLAVAPAMDAGAGWQTAAIKGGVLGFVAYATYDLTNHATLKVWPWQLTVVDIAWGSVLTATAAGVAMFAVERLMGPANS